MKESEIQNSILEYLTIKKIFHYRNNSGALPTKNGGFVRFGVAGSPDIVVVGDDGRYIGLEVKTPKGVQSKAQKEFQLALEEAGGEYYILRSIDDAMALF